VVLALVETTDLVFAVDSIPAVFGVTREPFIVYTSNVFAILGLRSLFFVLSGVMERFHLLRFGLAGVLAFVGVKMLAGHFIHVPTAVSLGVIALLLGASAIASLMIAPRPGSSPEAVAAGAGTSELVTLEGEPPPTGDDVTAPAEERPVGPIVNAAPRPR